MTLFMVGKAMGDNRHHVGIDSGMVHIRGMLTASACAVSPESANQIIDMGQFRSNQFNGVGSLSPPVAFSLKLKDCSIAVGNTIAISFQGESDGKDPQVLRAGEGDTSALGVGLALFDSQGELIVPNTPPRSLIPLTQGDMSLRFLARYRATSRQVTAGNVNVWTWFSLTYQ